MLALRYDGRADLGPGGPLRVQLWGVGAEQRLDDQRGEVGLEPAKTRDRTVTAGLTVDGCRVIGDSARVAGLLEGRYESFDPHDDLGGTMRLGSWPCQLHPESFAFRAYGAREVQERHRHRYEFNREYEDQLKAAGLRLTGETSDGTYVEICEIANHPWFLGCQFHPEFKSKPMEPHPLFKAFIGASYEYRMKRLAAEEEPLFARTD